MLHPALLLILSMYLKQVSLSYHSSSVLYHILLSIITLLMNPPLLRCFLPYLPLFLLYQNHLSLLSHIPLFLHSLVSPSSCFHNPQIPLYHSPLIRLARQNPHAAGRPRETTVAPPLETPPEASA
ncbi:hypothetical protein FKM82_029266 [Ascaphus truei]